MKETVPHHSYKNGFEKEVNQSGCTLVTAAADGTCSSSCQTEELLSIFRMTKEWGRLTLLCKGVLNNVRTWATRHAVLFVRVTWMPYATWNMYIFVSGHGSLGHFEMSLVSVGRLKARHTSILLRENKGFLDGNKGDSCLKVLEDIWVKESLYIFRKGLLYLIQRKRI